MKTMAKRIVAGLLLVVMICAAFTSCAGDKDSIQLIFTNAGEYTYNTYTAVSPSNWNELTYQDNNDTQIMSYIGSSFFGFDFKYDEEGKIVPGQFEVVYNAATKLEDVTAKYAEAWNISGSKYMAYAITLRNDLKWDDGTPIKAEDFVYSMQEQLNPLFQNYRADSFYVGSTIIANAQGYAKQGQSLETVDNGEAGIYSIEDLVKGEDGVYTQPDGQPVYFAMTEALDWCGGDSVTDYKDYLDAASFDALAALANAETGRVAVTDETIALWTALIDTEDWGHEPASNCAYYLVYPYTYPEVKFEEVGIFVGENEYEIVVILEKALDLIKEDGTLSYKAAYNFSSLPLVHKAKYEATKVAPAKGSTLWTSKYNSSVKTTASWGPYKLTFFQSGKAYILEKNENWYGYALPENEGLYQTDRIVCETIKEWNTAWLKFQAGEIDGIGIDVSIAQDYKNSDRAYFTPDDYVGSLQLQSSTEMLKVNESKDGKTGIDKEILGLVDFRKALSLSIDRVDYTAKCTTASLKGFGLYNTMHYYDVANGGVYRDTDEAKKVLCEIYNVDYTDTTKYPTLDDAVNAITGYDLEAAKALFTSAYNTAIEQGLLTADDKVVLTFGTGAVNESTQRHYDYLTSAWKKAVEGTPLEGKLDFELKDFANAWSKDFRAGEYEICMGGWTGAAWDPGYFLLAYLSPAYMYSAAWDTSNQMMTFTMVGVKDPETGKDITDTMSLMAWYKCLNGAADAKYNFSSAALDESLRIQLIAALEKEVLKVYYTVPTYNSFAASMLSHKLDYITYEYNTFMGYGGIKYWTHNYDDADWAKFVKENDGKLNYK